MLSSSAMPFTVKSLSCVSLLQFLLGILAFILGLLSIKDSSLYNGVFGMGLWIGGWVGLNSSSHYAAVKMFMFLSSFLTQLTYLPDVTSPHS